jgi:hypothetical protein
MFLSVRCGRCRSIERVQSDAIASQSKRYGKAYRLCLAWMRFSGMLCRMRECRVRMDALQRQIRYT